ncbi:hypothetical protein [Duganella sp.]|uniref:hypothetical protein n=1 Tax=Duganella sp. TaxID=1904440 RepID=UPI0031D4E98E
MQNAPFQLTTTQKEQVSLLYHFASLEYLKGLQQRLHALLASIDPTLDLAKLQNRDELLADPRWGTRNTADNWGNNGWPFLADFELSIATDIAKRAFESYSVTGANQCVRGLAELSLDWMTPEEEDDFQARLEQISVYAGNIDSTMYQHEASGRWDDFTLTVTLQEMPEVLQSAPALRLRPDVIGNTGQTPVRTGVYLPLDDPHGTPQFCWTGPPAGKLLECNTFNDLGLAALAALGRRQLWRDTRAMQAFAQSHAKDPRLAQDPFLADSLPEPELTPSLVGRHAFTTRPCSWIYVEQLHGQPMDWQDSSETATPTGGPRVDAGAPCPQAGYYFTPAKSDSRRHFVVGETMPEVGGQYGYTIWQWDSNQEDTK